MPLRELYAPSDKASQVDIIAIHGLNPRSKKAEKHAWNTWRKPATEQGRLWLRDDLPKATPDARIFLYEYDSTAVYGKDQGTFVDKANELLEAIRVKRGDEEETKPLLLLGHSLGGLLIRQALVNAHNNPKYTAVKLATSGIAFFGTPHNGGNKTLVALGGVAAKVALGLGFQKGDNIIETLESGSIFTEILQEHWRHQLLKYDILSFWGSRDTIVPRESSRFGLPGDRENIVKLDADHGDVCRFDTSEHDQDNYELVQGNIKDIYKNALKTATHAHQPTKAEYELRNKILQSLFQSKEHPSSNETDYLAHKTRNPNPVPGTCRWILNNPKYLHWLNAPSSNLLHLSADAGCGKSVLASFLIDTLSHASSQHQLKGQVCFFFFKDDNSVQSSALFALRALLHQCLIERPTLPKAIIKAYRIKGTALFDQFSCLWEAFKSLWHNETGDNIFCILDGLDECKEDSRRSLINNLVSYFNETSLDRGPFIKVIVSSRPDNFIKTSFNKLPTIRLRSNLEDQIPGPGLGLEIESEDTEHDVKLVIEHNLKELVEQDLIDTTTQKVLYSKLSASADQTFLWVSLIMNLLQEATIDGASQNELLSVLDDKRIESLYARFLTRCTKTSTLEAQARRLLQVIVAASRPMTVLELDYAVSVRSDQKSAADLKPNLHRSPENYIRQLCGHFIRCKSGNVYLVHQTARSFLLQQELAKENPQVSLGQFWHSINLSTAHSTLGDACVHYLYFSDFEFLPEEFGDNPWSDNMTKNHFCSLHPFSRYAASYWQLHLYLSNPKISAEVGQMAWQLCDTRTLRFWAWFYIANHRWAPKAAIETSVVYYFPLGVFLHSNMTTKEPGKRNPPHERPPRGEKVLPLEWAVKEGHLTVVKIIVCHLMVSICVRNHSATSRIFHEAVVAAAKDDRDPRRLDIVHRLIESGAHTFDELCDAIERYNMPVLRVLASFGDLAMHSRSGWPLQARLNILDCSLIRHLPSVSQDDQVSRLLIKLREDLLNTRNTLSTRRASVQSAGTFDFASIIASPLSPEWNAKAYKNTEKQLPNNTITKKIWGAEMRDLHPIEEKHQIAQNMARNGQYQDAIAIYESVLEDCRGSMEEMHHHLSVKFMLNLKEAQLSLQQEKATGLQEEEARRQRQKLEAARLRKQDAILSLSNFMNNVLNVHDEAQELHMQGQFNEAISIYIPVLKSLLQKQGNCDYEILTCLENLALATGRLGQTTTLVIQNFVLKGFLLMYGTSHPCSANSMRNLGVTYSRNQNLHLAEVCFEWAEIVYRTTLGINNPVSFLCHQYRNRAKEAIQDQIIRSIRTGEVTAPLDISTRAREPADLLQVIANAAQLDVQLLYNDGNFQGPHRDLARHMDKVLTLPIW